MKPHTDIFTGSRVAISKKDIKRLSEHILSSRRLNELLVGDCISAEDLRKMVLIEALKDQPRRTIICKLVGRIHSRQRTDILRTIFLRDAF